MIEMPTLPGPRADTRSASASFGFDDRPMEENKLVGKSPEPSTVTPPLPAGLPINWGLITGPVQPVLPPADLSLQLPSTQTSAVHALQTKVRSLTQKRTRARDREKEKERTPEPEGLLGLAPAGETQPTGAKPSGRCQVYHRPAPPWRSAATETLISSSDEEEDEEVEVQVRLEIHSPPAEAKGERALGAEGDDDGGTPERNQNLLCYLQGGTSLESLLSDNSSSSKDGPSPSPPSPPPPPPPPATSSLSSSSSPASSSTRRWAPPKGFWRVARPETLLLNSVGPCGMALTTLPVRDYTQGAEALEGPQMATGQAKAPGEAVASSELRPSDGADGAAESCDDKGLCSSDSWESVSSQADERLRVKQRAYAKLRERQRKCGEQSGGENPPCQEVVTSSCKDVQDWSETTADAVDESKGLPGAVDGSDSAFLARDLEPYLRSLLAVKDELPLSPRHEQAKILLERARLKARSNHIRSDRPCRRSHSDQRATVKKQQVEPPQTTQNEKTTVKTSQAKDELAAQTLAAPLLVPEPRDASPADQGGQARRYGCSPTRVRFEDESEKEAESRYLDRVRQRGRPGMPKSRSKESNTDSSSSSSERSRSYRSSSNPPSQAQEGGSISAEPKTVVKEIIVLVKKCEACGSVVREPQPGSLPLDPQKPEAQIPVSTEDSRGKAVPHWVHPNKPEVSTRPKAPLTVTFAGAYVLGETKEASSGWKSSGFGKLRRRSRKGESRLEAGHGPYGPSWAQRRNSNPRSRVNVSRAVSFAPGSPIALEPRLLEASGGSRESPPPALPIKSALKSSSKSRSAAGQPTVQFQVTTTSLGGDRGSQHAVLLDSPDVRRDTPGTSTQAAPAGGSTVSCVRPSTLRYSPARIPTDLPSAELWDATPDGAGLSGDMGSAAECRPALRGLALSRAEDLRAELLRAEHLKAEATWEENSDSSRKLDGRPKLFLRRFFSSIGLNSVGRLVKGGRSSSMEQLSLPAGPRVSSASPSPTRRPQPSMRIQRTPSLQTLHTVLPLAQLRKASSVQSLERRTERSTILGEVQIPYGLAPSPDSPQLELHRALSVEDVLASRLVRPVGRVTQVFSDGTLLLELVRPLNGPFGFVISRGKGRPDTGVYVEKVGETGGEGPYTGLLGVGDEILQVNGEAVADLSLDQVTRLMTRESIASLRIMPAYRTQR